MSEAETCLKVVLPKIYTAGWTDEQIREQDSFTDGRVVVVGGREEITSSAICTSRILAVAGEADARADTE